MDTNEDRLLLTIRHANKIWAEEQLWSETNYGKEGAWTVQVVEPILTALGWPRLAQGRLDGTGAYYEWPRKDNVDVALLDRGEPVAFWELKQKHLGRSSCHDDLARKLTKHPELRRAKIAVASWCLGKVGFCVYELRHGDLLHALPEVGLADAAPARDLLARLAAPELLRPGRGAQAWLHTTAGEGAPVLPRLSPRDVQRRFFDLLRDGLKLDKPLATHLGYGEREPPSPTFAFAELPDVPYNGWGLAFSVDYRLNLLQCLFYRGSPRMHHKVPDWSFDSGYSEDVLAAFVKDRVIPAVEDLG